MAVTKRDIPWLVYGAQRLREETYGCKTWDKQGTDVIFARELVGMNFQHAVELVVAHAVDPDAKTPASIKRPFKPDTTTARKRSGPPKKAEECPHHAGQFPPPHCGPCATEAVPAYYDLQETPMPNPTGLKGAAMVRARIGGGL